MISLRAPRRRARRRPLRRGSCACRPGITIHELSRALGRARPRAGEPRRHRRAERRRARSRPRRTAPARALRNIPSQVHALTLVLADGSTLELLARSATPRLFRAARVGLGSLGVIAEVTLRCVPAFTLRGVDAPAPLAGDARALRGAGARQRPLRVLRLPPRGDRADAHEQPHRASRRARAGRVAAYAQRRACSPTTRSACSAVPGGAARRGSRRSTGS